MCRGTVDDGSSFPFRQPLGGRGRKRLEVRAFYLRLSSSSPSCSSTAPNELTLVYHPPIGGAALELAGRALPPASPAEVTLVRVRDDDDASSAAPAYASADRVSAAEGARFEVFAGKELAAEGVFARRSGGEWRVECRRAPHSRSAAAVAVAEVVVLAEGGVLLRARATRSAGCLTRLEGIPEEEASWGACECGACGEDWEVVGDHDGSDSGDEEWKEREEAVEAETMRWALEMGAWAVCVGVGLLATARRFSRRRAIR
uniref:Uncharacterized protein n=1 Tax=Avena sativa TaxID=4498 RepID=A0ACD5TTK9_AVESA